MGPVAAALAVLLAVTTPATASPAPSGSPIPVEQGEHEGTLRAGGSAIFAVELAGGLARTQLDLDLPADARDVEVTLGFSVAAAPEVTCTRNAVVLEGTSADRPRLDTRRTDAPDPEDPCTQPGTHLLTAALADPAGTLDDRAIPFVLLVSVIGEEPVVDPPSAAAERERRPRRPRAACRVSVAGRGGGGARAASRRPCARHDRGGPGPPRRGRGPGPTAPRRVVTGATPLRRRANRTS